MTETRREIQRGAVLSTCGKFRFHLSRRWAEGGTLVFVMLNPSTADGTIDDPTIGRCMSFGQQFGFAGVEVVNLYAYRATKPTDLRAAGWPRHTAEDGWINTTIDQAVELGGAVCCAWGSLGGATARAEEVLGMIRRAGALPQCLGRAFSGAPRHPLYLRREVFLRPL